MSWLDHGLVFLVGAIAGVVNVFAGGGSLLTLPVLILIGLPAAVANGTNRVALVFQNVAATAAFRRRGVADVRLAGWLTLAALPGAIAGAIISVRLDDELFRRILAVLMVVAIGLTVLRRPARKPDARLAPITRRERLAAMIGFVFLGFYMGFIQAAVGFLVIATLGLVTRLDLVRINALKVMVILTTQIVALAVFLAAGKVDWVAGLVLAAGNALGGYGAAHLAVAGGEKWARRLLVAATLILAAKMGGLF